MHFKKVNVVEAAKEIAAKEASKGMGFMKLTSRATPYRLRIIPAMEGAEHDLPWTETKGHYVKIPGSDKAVFGNCGRAHDKTASCAVCELGEALTARGGNANLELAKECRPRYAGFVYVIDRENQEKGIKVLRMPWSVRQALMNWVTVPELGLTNFMDPHEGRDILLSKTGSGFQTEYAVQPDLNTSPICKSDEALEELFKGIETLDRYTKAPDYDAVKGRVQEALAASVGVMPAAEDPKAVEASVVDTDAGDGEIQF